MTTVKRLLIFSAILATALIIPLTLSAQEFEFYKPANEWENGIHIITAAKSKGALLGPTGLRGDRFGRNIWVRWVFPNSPAAGKVLNNDVIYGVNGKHFPAKGDLFRYFSKAITEAETKQAGGKLTLHIRRNDKLIKVPIQLKIMGSFSSTTPWNCEKSKNIVAGAEEFMRKGMRPETGLSHDSDYMYYTFHDSVLFLMASGNPELQGLVRRRIRYITERLDLQKAGKINFKKPGWVSDGSWQACYLSLLLGEYYHLTGDPTVLPHLEATCNYTLVRNSKGENWSPITGPTRYGTHPQMQIPETMGLVLANEAGLNINRNKLLFNLKYLNHKRAEYGYVKYCGYSTIPVEGRQIQAPKKVSETHKTTGKCASMNGKLGIAAALYNMVGGYKKTVKICAEHCVYSYNDTHRGHGGHWFNEFWTPIGAYHAGPEKLQLFMKGQQWWRELYRDHTGSMWQTGYAKGKQNILSTGWAIHNVMHFKRLRMLGAPRSYFCPNPPDGMKPALAAHRKRDYALAETLAQKVVASGKVPASAKERVNHFLNSVRTLKQSIEYDLTLTQKLLKQGNYALAAVELPQLQMVVSPNNPRLKAIARALESPKARSHIAAATKALGEKNRKVRLSSTGKREKIEKRRAEIVDLTKDDYAKYQSLFNKHYYHPAYPKNECSQWYIRKGSLADAPKGWEQPTFKPKWGKVTLPLGESKRGLGKKDPGFLLRTSFNVKDVKAFKALRMRMIGNVGDTTIYLNGKVVASGAGITKFKVLPMGVFNLKPSSLGLLRRGRNTLAIKCQKGGDYPTNKFNYSVRLEGILKNPPM